MTDNEIGELDRDCGNCIYTELNAEDPPCCYCSHVTGTKDYFTPISNEQSMKQRRVPSEDVQRAIDVVLTMKKVNSKLIRPSSMECTMEFAREQELLDLAITALQQMQGWIPVSEKLPESGVHVLFGCEVRPSKRQYVCDGFYAASKTITSTNYDECAAEYDESKDEYFLLEGFYEVIKNWDDFPSIVISDFVTHWMPLPPKP